MNTILIKLVHQSAVAKLPQFQREIYQFIENQESILEDHSLNEMQFLQLLIEKSPYKAAAEYFSLDLETVIKTLEEAQEIIDSEINERCSRTRWIYLREIDYLKMHCTGDIKQTFLFIS